MLRTLADVGPRRIQRRLRYELRQRLDRQLPPQLAAAWAGCNGPAPDWRQAQQPNVPHGLLPPPAPERRPTSVRFCFLNEERVLRCPIAWNDPSWPRLWQFHLHDFDWARDWLDQADKTGSWPAEAWALEPLFDHWIAANPPGRGDGWHSYTLSLRTRNWIRLFRRCPALVTAERLQSLWQQLRWLAAHPEHCHGGNHWLENLTALALGGLQFGGPQAKAMQARAMRLLQKELADQVLPDGGHQERSASYHLLMLDRLVALAGALVEFSEELPQWLVGAIDAMASWARAVRLENGEAPRFNDSAADAAPPLDAVLAAAQALLKQQPTQPACPTVPLAVTDLAHTGWTLLRPGQGWELAFKCGVPCPPHLGAHAHSDLLSVDLWHHGEPVIAEVGTSIYGSGPRRQMERSSAAHNALQLGVQRGERVVWIEPVEVWASFRAGRKAQPQDRAHGSAGPWLWVCGSHDGHRRIGATHQRWVAMRLIGAGLPLLVVMDRITTIRPVRWRRWFHLGPGQPNALEQRGLVLHQVHPVDDFCSRTERSDMALGFGRRVERPVIEQQGVWPAGCHHMVSVLAARSLVFRCQMLSDQSSCLLELGAYGSINVSGASRPVFVV